MKITHLSALAAIALALTLPKASGQGTAFTYQGRLNNNGSLAGGSYDFKFTLYTNSATGNVIAGPVTNTAVFVTNGLFTTLVDFGSAFNGTSNWLELAVSTNAANNFTTLAPRQQVTPVPYALTAASANFVSAANINGSLAAAQLPSGVLTNGASGVNLSGMFSGDGSGLSNLPAANMSGTVPFASLGTTNSYTPTIGNGSAIFTTTNASGYYAKVGSLVYFEVWVVWSDKGSASSGALVVSLPPIPVASNRAVFNTGFMTGINTDEQVIPVASVSATACNFYAINASSGSISSVFVQACAASGELQITGWYRWQ